MEMMGIHSAARARAGRTGRLSQLAMS
jgi:hypothetical protein